MPETALPTISALEEARLEELQSLEILDTSSEERFDNITQLAAEVFEVPVALITLVDLNRQWFKSACGWSIQETTRDISFCAHALKEPEMLLIPDAAADPRFAENPLVTGEPFIRFYAGAVVRGPTGQPLGTLCLIDHQPRELSNGQRRQLLRFARLAEKEIQHNYHLRRLREQIVRTINYDPLTQLPNQRLIRELLRESLQAARTYGRRIVVLYIDLLRFGDLNAALGRETGDLVLKETAKRLREAVDPVCTVGRWRDDNFVVFTALATKSQTPLSIVEPVLEHFSRPFQVGEHAPFVNLRIGGSLFPTDGEEETVLLEKAMAALPEKGSGFSDYSFYREEIEASNTRRYQLENRLRQALEKDRLYLKYQPKIDLASGKIAGMEALLRWDDPDLGEVSPVDFIPLAEKIGLIFSIGDWVLRTACEQYRTWSDQGLAPPTFAVNLTSDQLLRSSFVERTREILAETGVEGKHLDLEVTESGLIEDMDKARQKMQEVAKDGVSFSIDDFGTGYSSLSNLQRLPLRHLKIDRSFIRDMVGNSEDASIAQSIIALAHSLGIKVVAEGVEEREQLLFLKAYKCDLIQGYIFARPMTSKDLTLLLKEQPVFGV